MSIFLLLAVIFLFTILFGILLEKIHIPWVFAALILGVILSFYNPFWETFNSEVFQWLAKLGMYFLLFLIGFELDIGQIRKLGKFIVKATFFIICFEAFFGSLLIHFVFDYNWLISVLVAISFATVGEAMLVPILDRFKLMKTKLGNAIIGIGTLDDIIEISVIIAVVILASTLFGIQSEISLDIKLIIFALVGLVLLTLGWLAARERIRRVRVPDVSFLFLFSVFAFFLFVGVGNLAEASIIGALLAGLVIRLSIPREKLEIIEQEVKGVAYGFFGPLFFVWVGAETQIKVSYLGLIFLVIGVTYFAKILASYMVGKDTLGKKPSVVMGIALGVRLSTSIIIITILYRELNLIGVELYSVLIGSTIAFKFIVPFLLSYLITKWKIAPVKLKDR